MAKWQVKLAEIVETAQIADGMRRLTLKASQLALSVSPGQFVMVKTEANGALLGRPFGVSGVDREKGYLTLRFAVVGKGTAWLAGRKAGDTVSLSGPYGKGFSVMSGRSILIGGGTGVAPLLFLKEEIEAAGGCATLLAGAKGKTCLMESDMIQASCMIVTEDGSLGEEGFVTAPLKRLLCGLSFEYAYACGPVQMLKEVKALTDEAGIPLEVSLETLMGCGVGACNGCTCNEAKKGEGWAKVCKDGPVFAATEVLV